MERVVLLTNSPCLLKNTGLLGFGSVISGEDVAFVVFGRDIATGIVGSVTQAFHNTLRETSTYPHTVTSRHRRYLSRSLTPSSSIDLLAHQSISSMDPWNQQPSSNNDDSKHARSHDTDDTHQPSPSRTRLPHHQHNRMNSNYNALLLNNNNLAAISANASSHSSVGSSSIARRDRFPSASSFSTLCSSASFLSNPFVSTSTFSPSPHSLPFSIAASSPRPQHAHTCHPSSFRALSQYTGHVLGKRGDQRYVRDSRPGKRRCRNQSRNVHAMETEVARVATDGDVEMDGGGN